MAAKMQSYNVMCDMASMKVHFEGVGSCFFMNDYGDGFFEVHIIPKGEDSIREREDLNLDFLGHFTVCESGKATLQQSDCAIDLPLHTFERGRWFVYYESREGAWYVQHNDMDIHA